MKMRVKMRMGCSWKRSVRRTDKEEEGGMPMPRVSP